MARSVWSACASAPLCVGRHRSLYAESGGEPQACLRRAAVGAEGTHQRRGRQALQTLRDPAADLTPDHMLQGTAAQQLG